MANCIFQISPAPEMQSNRLLTDGYFLKTVAQGYLKQWHKSNGWAPKTEILHCQVFVLAYFKNRTGTVTRIYGPSTRKRSICAETKAIVKACHEFHIQENFRTLTIA